MCFHASLQFRHLQTFPLTNYYDVRSLKTAELEHFDLDPLLIEFFRRGHRELASKLKEKKASGDVCHDDEPIETLHPPFAFLLKFLPTNQQMYLVGLFPSYASTLRLTNFIWFNLGRISFILLPSLDGLIRCSLGCS